MKKRIIGIDVARALAVIGMIIVNFKVVFGENGSSWLKAITAIFEGKAAATFVVLAGVGLALMTNTAVQNNDKLKLRIARIKIVKRAFFLFLIGSTYLFIWPADILHYYGVYMIFAAFLLASNHKTILILGMIPILIYPLLMVFWNYDSGWNYSTMDYQFLWTFKGFFRNLLFNGFHPVMPWASFILFGLWLGKQDLNNNKFVKKLFWISLIAFVSIQCFSFFGITLLANGNTTIADELSFFLGTKPMPPLPIFMLNGISVAFVIISACIITAKRFKNSYIISALHKTGQLALTFYVAHVVIGMGIIELISPIKLGQHNIIFSIISAIVFSVLCIIFAVLWLKYKKHGPLEWIMRKISN